MTEQTEAAEVVVLADEILAKADHAFPWPGELDELIADDIAKAILASDWLAAREAAVEARGRAQRMDYAAVSGYNLGYAEALWEAAEAVRDVREHGLPEGVDSHPTAEWFEDWLRARAAASRTPQDGA